MRDYWVLNLEWLKSHGAYCYSNRFFYEDAEWQPSVPLESYDRSGRFWKAVWEALTPINFRGQRTMIEIASIGMVSGVDFENSHITATVESPTTVDADGAGTIAGPVPAQYRDVSEITTPGSLDRIMR